MTQIKSVTFLGPLGATFSHEAYNFLAEKFDAPEVALGTEFLSDTQYVPAESNSEILQLICQNGAGGGYGAIAVETLAEGRVSESVESFIDLLKTFDSETCPFHIVGAVNLPVHFALMVRKGVEQESVHKVVAHIKALGACKNNLAKINAITHAVSSNGEASRLLAKGEFANCDTSAVLGPASAARKYDLEILDAHFEDAPAVTTFFLIAPREHAVVTASQNKALIVFRLPNESGALVHVLSAFSKQKLNLKQVHSTYVGDAEYHFAIEVDVPGENIPGFETAIAEFKQYSDRYIVFGPFAVFAV